jgi:hypothetical protein
VQQSVTLRSIDRVPQKNCDWMKPENQKLQKLALRLFEYEATKSANADEPVKAIESCCQRLHDRLDRLIGPGGFRAILYRALYLAKKKYAWLEGVGIEDYPGCEFKDLREAVKGKKPATVNDACTLILANVIWLLVTFIGEDITFGLIQEAWPDVRTDIAASNSKEAKLDE